MIHNLKNKITAEYFKDVLESKGYKFFTNGDLNINIIGVRNPNLEANKFDDTMIIIFKIAGEWIIHEYQITTDAGDYWLENPMKSNGCALLVPNQYRSVYKIDYHLGKYLALCQRNGKVEVYRDDNKDQILDFNDVSKEWGYFGINIHRSNPRNESYEVNKWSAGCQVFKKIDDYNEFLDICTRSMKKYGNSFTYTLINESDLNL